MREPPAGEGRDDTHSQVSDAVCAEEASNPAEPDWVKLACKVEGVAGGVVHVILPRAKWQAMRSRALDAGNSGAGGGR